MPKFFKGKVSPMNSTLEFPNPSYESSNEGSMELARRNNAIKEADDDAADDDAPSDEQLAKRRQTMGRKDILKAVTLVNRWNDYDVRKRPGKPAIGVVQSTDTSEALRNYHTNLNKNISGIHAVIDDKLSETSDPGYVNLNANEALVIYMAKLAKGKDELIDLEFVNNLLESGADVNATDIYGQTVLHEVARAWQPDIARYLLSKGADVNRADKYGRRPLHMAAAVNHPQMISLFIEHEAVLDCQTYGELQTPCHYAARNDALDALKLLHKQGADIEAKDFKLRTPLQIAAELDRSTTAKFLVDEGAFVGTCEESGLPALSLMIEKMTNISRDAILRLHQTDGPNRRQMFYLNYLDPLSTSRSSSARSPMTMAVKGHHITLITDEPFKKLLQVKWRLFGKQRHIGNMVLYLLYIVLWTTIGVSLPSIDHDRKFSGYRKIWRMCLDGLSICGSLYYIILELTRIVRSVKTNKQYKSWRIKELERDLKYAHPRWPEETNFIYTEIEAVKNAYEPYFTDLWNLFDWFVNFFVMASIVTNVFAITYCLDPSKAPGISKWHETVIALTLIFVWLRLMKYIRAFQTIGPFIVMIGQIVVDTLKFTFLFMEVFIPFYLAFFILFGGEENQKVRVSQGYNSTKWYKPEDVAYSTWQIVVGGDYDFKSLEMINEHLAKTMVALFAALTMIILLNLFIALMSNSFQAVYDNAKANTMMQQAGIVLGIEAYSSKKTNAKWMAHITENCSPLIEFWDDDMDEPDEKIEKVTIQIKATLDDMVESLEKQKIMSGDLSNTDISVKQISNDLEKMGKQYTTDILDINAKIAGLTNLIQDLLDEQRLHSQALHDQKTSYKEGFSKQEKLLSKHHQQHAAEMDDVKAQLRQLVADAQQQTAMQEQQLQQRNEEEEYQQQQQLMQQKVQQQVQQKVQQMQMQQQQQYQQPLPMQSPPMQQPIPMQQPGYQRPHTQGDIVDGRGGYYEEDYQQQQRPRTMSGNRDPSPRRPSRASSLPPVQPNYGGFMNNNMR